MTSHLGNRSRKISLPVERVLEQINPTLRVN
jgi:hypothetical protein